MPSFKLLATDPERSLGMWFCAQFFDPKPLPGPHPSLLCVKVARVGNPKYRDREAELYVSSADELRAGGETAEKARESIRNALIAECLLVDWVNADEGPYSVSLSRKLIEDPRYDRLRTFVWQCAHSVDAFAAEIEEGVLKN